MSIEWLNELLGSLVFRKVIMRTDFNKRTWKIKSKLYGFLDNNNKFSETKCYRHILIPNEVLAFLRATNGEENLELNHLITSLCQVIYWLLGMPFWHDVQYILCTQKIIIKWTLHCVKEITDRRVRERRTVSSIKKLPAGYWTSLCHSLLICKLGMIIPNPGILSNCDQTWDNWCEVIWFIRNSSQS